MGFRKGRGTRGKIANICWIIKKAKESRKISIYFCFIDYAKAFDCVDHKELCDHTIFVDPHNCCVDHNKLWKILKDGDTRPASWEICMQAKKQQLEPDMKQWTGSKLGKKDIKII